jgi:hypothetical protein
MGIDEQSHAVVHALGVKGFGTLEALEAATGISAGELALALDRLAADSLVEAKARRVPGYALTAGGRTEHRRLLTEARAALARQHDLVWLYHHVFLPLDQALKQACTDWQLRPNGSNALVPNDHDDAAYDAGIGRRFTRIHHRAGPLLAYYGRSLAPRFGRYEHRLSSAHGRFQAGESAALCQPLADSYHDTWMEVHHDLLLSLDQERAGDDG